MDNKVSSNKKCCVDCGSDCTNNFKLYKGNRCDRCINEFWDDQDKVSDGMKDMIEEADY